MPSIALRAAIPWSKLRGGLDRLVALGAQPDERLDYLVPGYRHGDFVFYVVVDRSAADRVRDVERTGARVRWAFRSVDAISVVAPKKALLALAAQPWVRYLYPVLSGRVDDTQTTIRGTITRGDAPQAYPVEVAAGSRSVTVDLTVAPPGPPTFDYDVTDFIEAILMTPSGRAVAVRPLLLEHISFRYAENDALEAGSWTLKIVYRSANQPTAPVIYSFNGSVTVGTQPVSRTTAAIPSAACSGVADPKPWKENPNLKKRGVTDIGAPVLWDEGIRGRGVRLAVLDTGVDKSHADLDDQDFEHWGQSGCEPKIIADELFFGGQAIPGQGAFDTGSHGTHVAGEAAGTAEGADASQHGTYPGVAPEASLVVGRIAIDVTALTDDMLAAGEWAVIDQKADVVSLSFGIDVRYGALTDRLDPQTIGFEALTSSPAWGNPTINVAAGNAGDLFQTIAAPGSASHVNTIAAATKDWDLTLPGGEMTEDGRSTGRGVADARGRFHPSITSFSSRGPSQDFFFAPDFAAPGRDIVAPLTNQNTDGETNGYASFSGTSMATPHASGSAALLVDAYRQRFGTAGPFGNRPPFWIVAAALSNTAGPPAPRPAFAGGPLAKVAYAPGSGGLYPMYGEMGSRENTIAPLPPVGPLVEGAGRINLPAAISAMSDGVLIYTAGDPKSASWYELQPSFQVGTVEPTQTVTRAVTIHPATTHRYVVSFRAVAGTASLNASVIPPSWWTVPAPATVSAPEEASISLTVPDGTKPGYYTGYVLADVTDTATGARWTLRMPALAIVELADYDPAEGNGQIVDGFTKAKGRSVAFNGVVGVSSDWPMYAITVPAGTEKLNLSLNGQDSSDVWDLVVYDETGLSIADTFTSAPSTSASLSLSGLDPGLYRVAVSLSIPDGGNTDASGPRGRPFQLTADLVGAVTPKVLGVTRSRPGSAHGARAVPNRGLLPATGVSSHRAIALVMLAASVGLAAVLRGRKRGLVS